MSSSKTVTERVEAAHRELRKLTRRFRVGAWFTGIVGFALLLLVAGYFFYGYKEISDLKDPDLLVSLLGNTLDQQIPLVRRALQERVDNDASVWAEQASEQVMAALPRLREALEDYACKQTDEAIDKFKVIGDKEFRRLLEENRATIQQALQDLENDDEVSDGVVKMLQEGLEKEMQVSMESQVATIVSILNDLNESGEKLRLGEDLSEEQQHDRRALMIVRRLQQERFGDLRLEEISSPIVTGLVEDLEKARLEKESSSGAAESSEPAKEDAGGSENDAKPEE